MVWPINDVQYGFCLLWSSDFPHRALGIHVRPRPGSFTHMVIYPLLTMLGSLSYVIGACFLPALVCGNALGHLCGGDRRNQVLLYHGRDAQCLPSNQVPCALAHPLPPGGWALPICRPADQARPAAAAAWGRRQAGSALWCLRDSGPERAVQGSSGADCKATAGPVQRLTQTKGPWLPLVTRHKASACNCLFTRKMETWPLEVGDSRVDREGRVMGCVPARGTQQGEQGCFPGCDEGLRRVLNTDLMKSVGFPKETLTSRQASLLMKNSIQISVTITARVGLKWPK